ncbi:MAG: hypothetical protein JKX97_01045 [Candidatus Lindowbacteria bacterium]|nr:hypothetical protein [Candidatus Lindowbacteria bacterium]
MNYAVNDVINYFQLLGYKFEHGAQKTKNVPLPTIGFHLFRDYMWAEFQELPSHAANAQPSETHIFAYKSHEEIGCRDSADPEPMTWPRTDTQVLKYMDRYILTARNKNLVVYIDDCLSEVPTDLEQSADLALTQFLDDFNKYTPLVHLKLAEKNDPEISSY